MILRSDYKDKIGQYVFTSLSAGGYNLEKKNVLHELDNTGYLSILCRQLLRSEHQQIDMTGTSDNVHHLRLKKKHVLETGCLRKNLPWWAH
jgi:hypothetical protein